jgi:hypothetical protein
VVLVAHFFCDLYVDKLFQTTERSALELSALVALFGTTFAVHRPEYIFAAVKPG